MAAPCHRNFTCIVTMVPATANAPARARGLCRGAARGGSCSRPYSPCRRGLRCVRATATATTGTCGGCIDRRGNGRAERTRWRTPTCPRGQNGWQWKQCQNGVITTVPNTPPRCGTTRARVPCCRAPRVRTAAESGGAPVARNDVRRRLYTVIRFRGVNATTLRENTDVIRNHVVTDTGLGNLVDASSTNVTVAGTAPNGDVLVQVSVTVSSDAAPDFNTVEAARLDVERGLDTLSTANGSAMFTQELQEDPDFVATEQEIEEMKATIGDANDNPVVCQRDSVGNIVCTREGMASSEMTTTGPPMEIALIVVGAFVLGAIMFWWYGGFSSSPQSIKMRGTKRPPDYPTVPDANERQSMVYEGEDDQYETGTISRFNE